MGKHAPCRVLVVDDDEAIRDTLDDLLSEEGYTITTAANGRAALDLLEHAPPPALILLDLMMPEMNGYELFDELHKQTRFRDIPVIVLSAYSFSDQVRAPLDAAAFLPKPLDLSRLLALVARFCP